MELFQSCRISPQWSSWQRSFYLFFLRPEFGSDPFTLLQFNIGQRYLWPNHSTLCTNTIELSFPLKCQQWRIVGSEKCVGTLWIDAHFLSLQAVRSRRPLQLKSTDWLLNLTNQSREKGTAVTGVKMWYKDDGLDSYTHTQTPKCILCMECTRRSAAIGERGSIIMCTDLNWSEITMVTNYWLLILILTNSQDVFKC